MREIKYRLWDKILKRHFPVRSIYFITQSVEFYFDEDFQGYKKGQTDFRSFADCVLEQFTGLTDKNGVEIYEGDKVRLFWSSGLSMETTIAVVKYDNNLTSFVLDDGKRRDFFFAENNFNPIVIGNIHEGGSNEA